MKKLNPATVQSLEQIKAEYARRRASVRALDSYITPVEEIIKSIQWRNESGEAFYDTQFSSYGHLAITVTRLSGFKDERLAALMSAILDLGFEPTRSNNYSSGECLNIDYSFRIQHSKTQSVGLTIYAYVRSDSETCRLVPDGEETIVKPKFRLECD
jgi:hypothetical protein